MNRHWGCIPARSGIQKKKKDPRTLYPTFISAMKQQQGGGNELHDIFCTVEENTAENSVSADCECTEI